MEMTISSLKNWSDAVKEAYLVNRMEPNDMVEELARANDLNSSQIQRLCQASNVSIKMASRAGKIDDVMFPLASATEVSARLQPSSDWEDTMGEDKMASLAPESRGREFGRFYLLNKDRPQMTKTASTAGLSASACGAVFSETDRRYKVRRRELETTKSAAANCFSEIMEYLGEEAKVARDLNGSYTAVKTVVKDSLVDDIYKVAHKMICEGHVYPYPAPSIIKTAGRAVNPESQIIASIKKYASCLGEIEKQNQLLNIATEERKLASRILQTSILREI